MVGVTMSPVGTWSGSSTMTTSRLVRRSAACKASPAPNATAVAMTSSAGPSVGVSGPASSSTCVPAGPWPRGAQRPLRRRRAGARDDDDRCGARSAARRGGTAPTRHAAVQRAFTVDDVGGRAGSSCRPYPRRRPSSRRPRCGALSSSAVRKSLRGTGAARSSASATMSCGADASTTSRAYRFGTAGTLPRAWNAASGPSPWPPSCCDSRPGLTGALLIFLLADFPEYGGTGGGGLHHRRLHGALLRCGAGALSAVRPALGSGRHHRVMQIGPVFGLVAVVLTAFTAEIQLGARRHRLPVLVGSLPLLGLTRLLEGASHRRQRALGPGLHRRRHQRRRGAARQGLGALRGGHHRRAGLRLRRRRPGVAAAGPSRLPGQRPHLRGGLRRCYRWFVPDVAPEPRRPPPRGLGWRRYRRLLRRSRVWLLAPTWIALNAGPGSVHLPDVVPAGAQPDERFERPVARGWLRPTARDPRLRRGRRPSSWRAALLGRALRDAAAHDHHLLRHRRRRDLRRLCAAAQPHRRRCRCSCGCRGWLGWGWGCSCSRAPRLPPSGCWPTCPSRSRPIAARSWASTASSSRWGRSSARSSVLPPPRHGPSTASSWPRSLLQVVAMLPLSRLRRFEFEFQATPASGPDPEATAVDLSVTRAYRDAPGDEG